MKTRYKYSLLVVTLTLILFVSVALSMFTQVSSLEKGQPQPTPMSVPVDGEEAPVTPRVLGNDTVSVEESVAHAVEFDISWVDRTYSLNSENFIVLNDVTEAQSLSDNNISVIIFSSRQEAANALKLGSVYVDETDRTEPVYVIIVKGKGLVPDSHGPAYETDSVVYIISQKTGEILSWGEGILKHLRQQAEDTAGSGASTAGGRRQFLSAKGP